MNRAVTCALVTLLLLFAVWPTKVLAQPPKAGVVTTIHGRATVARAALPQELRLKFRDDLFLRDRITTQAESIVRALLGGKALVTIRELSVVTITEEVDRATVDMEAGKIALAVARRLLRPGETLEIRTPNAIAAVRGTVVIVEALRPAAQPPVTNFHVLKGAIEVLRRGIPGAIPTTVAAGFSLTITGNVMRQVRPTPPLTQIVQGLESPPQHTDTPEEAKQQVSSSSVDQATALAVVLGGAQPAKEKPKAKPKEKPKPTARATQPAAPPAPPVPDDLLKVFAGKQPTPLPPPPPPKPAPPPIIPTTTTPLPPPGPDVSISGDVTVAPGQTLKTFGGSTTRSDSSPVVRITGSTVTHSGADGALILVDAGANAKLAGPLLRVTNSTLTGTGQVDVLEVKGSLTSTTTSALISHDPTKVNADNFVSIESGGELFLAGSLLKDVGGTLSTSDDFLEVEGTLTSTSSSPLLQLSNTTLTVSSGKLLAVRLFDGATPGSASLKGPLLAASNANLTVDFSLAFIAGGGQLTVTGSTDPLVSITGGTHSIASAGGFAMVQLAGINTAVDPSTGLTLGIDEPLKHSGGVLEVSGATVTGQKAFQIDTALLQASAPLLNLKGGSNFTTSADTVDLSFKAKVTSIGPLVKLNGSTLDVKSGALINLAGGSFLNVTGDLLALANGSALNLRNGPILSVSNASAVNISGALVAFSGTGANHINVSNSLCSSSCTTFGGIPVALKDGALPSNVSIGGNVIKNSSLGSIQPSSSNTAFIVVSGPNSKVTISGQ
ncbi:MAG: FecR domain-containing protein [Candidatus Methylomirabilia bacterium]